MRPPRAAVAIVRRAVPADAAGASVIGDLQQEFDERCAARGRGAARVWYWRQAISIWLWSAWAHPHNSHHDPRGGVLFDIIGDFRHGVRTARKTPGQTALIVTTLAIAIGSTTIGFSLADTIMLRGLPIAEPKDTVIIYAVDPRQPTLRTGVFAADYLDFRDRSRTLEQLSAWSRERSTLVRDGSVYATEVGRVAGDLFGAWGIRARIGRTLRTGDDRPGAPPVAVLAHHYWQSMFAGAPSVVGTTILLDAVPHQIVGVLDPAIEVGNFANLGVWAPLPLERGGPRDARSMVVTGRLAGTATVEAAAAEIASLARQIELESPATNRGRGVSVLVSHRAIGGPNFWIVITLLISAVTLIMVIASANVAGVLLARAAVRQREFGLRVALGARRLRIFRQLLAEGLLLAVLGGAGGLAAAEAGLRLIRSIEAEEIFRQIVVDWHEVAFVALLAVLTPLLFSLAPALAALRSNLPSLLNAGGPRIAASAGRGRQLLVVAQLALAVTFVTFAGLVLRTGTAMTSAPTGFDPSRLLVFTLTFDDVTHRGGVTRYQIVRDIETRLGQTAGVLSTGALDALPAVAIEATVPLEIEGRPNAEGEPAPWAHVVALDADALDALGIPLLAGRALTEADIETDADVALVSNATALRHFGSIDRAIGRRLKVRLQGAIRDRQIVGVTGDARYVEPERGMPPRVWIPLSEPRRISIVVRAAGDPAALAPAVRQIAREVAPSLPIEGLETYDAAIARRMGSDRIIFGMMLSFALVALLFATTGLYGIVAFNTSQRRTEFGTRFALGAQVRDVVALVLGQAFRLLAVGLAIGLLAGLAVARVMRSTLYGVSPTDPLNLVVVVILLSLVTLAASVMPAWRAARIGIASALRGD